MYTIKYSILKILIAIYEHIMYVILMLYVDSKNRGYYLCYRCEKKERKRHLQLNVYIRRRMYVNISFIRTIYRVTSFQNHSVNIGIL